MFHRIAAPACDPWGLSVAPSRFEEQLHALKAHRIPLSMSEFVDRLENGTLPARAVAVTFDDGYGDNLRVAKPILEEVGIPATVFVTTGYVGKQKEFWWDELARLILDRCEAVEGTLTIGKRTVAVRLPALPETAARPSTWRAWNRPRTPREHLYFEIWNELRVLEYSAREQGLECLRELCGPQSPPNENLPMTAEEVRNLVAGTHIDIGAHSETHQPLTTLGASAQRREIQGSRDDCERLTGKPVHGFAYPHGDFDALTVELVRASGFRWACSTNRAAVDCARSERFNLPRLQALNWTALELERALNQTRTDA